MSANHTKTGCSPAAQSNSFSKNRVFLLLLLLGTVVAAAPTAAPTRFASLYLLNHDSTFEQGCFPPCACPAMIQAPVQGTFSLTPTGFDGRFYTYDVTDVNWTVTLNDTTMLITGTGAYKIGGEFALEQQLSLDLQMGEGGTPEHFDSGLVAVPPPPSPPFPDINITISTNGQVCSDKVFNLSTSPARRDR